MAGLHAHFMLEEPVVKVAHAVSAYKIKALLVCACASDHSHGGTTEVEFDVPLVFVQQVLRGVSRVVLTSREVLPLEIPPLKENGTGFWVNLKPKAEGMTI